MIEITAYYVVNGSKSERKEISIKVEDVNRQRKVMEATLPEGYKIFFEYRCQQILRHRLRLKIMYPLLQDTFLSLKKHHI